MTGLLKEMLRDDYLIIIKAKMLECHFNNTSLSRRTGYSKAHIGNVMKGRGSDDSINAVCTAIGLKITELFKPGIIQSGSNDVRKAV